ncbi:hypothetical protein ACJIZ3_004486 [Penstemon smallii]|uniref:DUF7950 domain-containing protein n=1 Tax=Penstemon smallii TaxID=265156 RepID=A0ABD3S278_9LAMI
MEQSGGCCIARYAGGAYDINISKVNRIMMKFRPIAPKPPSPNASASATPENSDPSVKSATGRGKRRNTSTTVTKRCGGGRKRKRTTSSANSISDQKVVKTLPLLPESPDMKNKGAKQSSYPLWLSFADGGHVRPGLGHVAGLKNPVVIGSWVRVECVIDTWLVDGLYGGIGRTDEEKVIGLDLDTCPGFVSDGLNRVKWTNGAYKAMVAGNGEAEVEVVAWVVVEEGVVIPVGSVGFTCRVRVVTCGKEKGCGKTVPCDVWRMECGGFAWRLDTTAALSLGR